MGLFGRKSQTSEMSEPPPLPPQQGDAFDDQPMEEDYMMDQPMSGEFSEYEWADEDDGMGAITEASETSSWGGRESINSGWEGGSQATQSMRSDASFGGKSQGSRMSRQSARSKASSRAPSMASSRAPSMASGRPESMMSDGSYMTGDRQSMMSDGSYMTGDRQSMMSDGSYMSDGQSYASQNRESMMSDGSYMTGDRQSMMSDGSYMSDGQSYASQNRESMMSDGSYMTEGTARQSMVSDGRQSYQSSRAPSMKSQGSRVSRKSAASRQSSRSTRSKQSSRAPSMASSRAASSRVPSMASGRPESMMSDGSYMTGDRQSMMSDGSYMTGDRQSMMSDGSYMTDNRQSMMSDQSGASRQSYQVPSMRQSTASSKQGSVRESYQSDVSEGEWDAQTRQSMMSTGSRAPSVRSAASRQSSRSTKSARSRSSKRSTKSNMNAANPAAAHDNFESMAIPEEDTFENDSVSFSSGSDNGAGDPADVTVPGGHSRYTKSSDGKWSATQSTRMNVPFFLRRQTVRKVPMVKNGGGDLGRAPIPQVKEDKDYYAGDRSSKGSNGSGSKATGGGSHSRYTRGDNGKWQATQSTRLHNVPGILKRFTMRITRDSNHVGAGGLGRNTNMPKRVDLKEGYY